MKKIIFMAVVFVFIGVSFSFAGEVKGYWKDTNHDGAKDTYVQPHQRTSPNESRTDNYSYPGNYNPNSGSVTPPSSSPRETYPSNPNPYGSKNKYGY